MDTPSPDSRLAGLLLATALGDSLGLPLEGLSPRRARRLFPGPLRQRLLPGRGMVSDDTDHAFFVAQSLLVHPRDGRAFQRRLAWCLRGWLVALPVGIGWATLRSLTKLCLGVSPDRSGVASAGNGPAMRSPLIGAFFANDPERLEEAVRVSTRLTHVDPKAEIGALAVARVAALICRHDALDRPEASEWLDAMRPPQADEDWLDILETSAGAMQDGTTVESVIRLGGDTDTVAAVAGALAGLQVGEGGLPPEHMKRIWDPFRGLEALRTAGRRLAGAQESGKDQKPVQWLWYLLPVRHLIQIPIVLTHGFRRLLPPYGGSGR